MSQILMQNQKDHSCKHLSVPITLPQLGTNQTIHMFDQVNGE